MQKRLVSGVLPLVMVLAGSDWRAHAQGWVETDVVPFADRSEVVGKARLSRDTNSFTMTFEARGLMPGWAYTVWWVVFNNPEHCVDGCGGDDLDRPAVLGSSLYADGVIPGSNGRIHAAGRRTVGYRGVIAVGSGIVNVETAEVHLVVRSHGPQIAGLTGSQLTTFNGGCPPAAGFPPNANGLPGGNTCRNILIAEFPRP